MWYVPPLPAAEMGLWRSSVCYVHIYNTSGAGWKQDMQGSMKTVSMLWSQRQKLWLKVFDSRVADMVQFSSSVKKKSLMKSLVPEFGGRDWRNSGVCLLSPSGEVFPTTCSWPCEWPLWAVGGCREYTWRNKTCWQKKNKLISDYLELSDRDQCLHNMWLTSLPNILLAIICIILLKLTCKLYLIKHLGSVNPCGMYSRVKLSVWSLVFSMPEQRAVSLSNQWEIIPNTRTHRCFYPQATG